MQNHLVRDAAGVEELLLELGRGAHHRGVAQVHRVAVETSGGAGGRGGSNRESLDGGFRKSSHRHSKHENLLSDLI